MSKKNLVTDPTAAQAPRSGAVLSDDSRWMRVALAAGRRAEGRTGSNPPVGCALVSADGVLLSEGHTGRGGVPHAEAAALDNLRQRDGGLQRLAGGTAFVTLEPCAHHGKTPPCITALIDAGIARLVVALQDPDHRVDGAGLAAATAAGIAVTTGVGAAEANDQLLPFIYRVQNNKPFCSLKVASSMDGRIALADRKKRWLTGPAMRRYVHLLRSRADALATGIGTVLSDDPQLTCRDAGLDDDSPPVFLFDSDLRLSHRAQLLQHPRPLTVFHRAGVPAERCKPLAAAGATLVTMPSDADGRPAIAAALAFLAESGVNHLMVEAGTGLATGFLQAGAINRIYWTQSTHILGGDALPAVGPRALSPVNDMAFSPETKYTLSRQQMIGDDHLLILEKPAL